MNFINDFWWVWLVAFVFSGAYILYARKKASEGVNAQFVVTGGLLLLFYSVCFLSGICNILNFIWRWVL